VALLSYAGIIRDSMDGILLAWRMRSGRCPLGPPALLSDAPSLSEAVLRHLFRRTRKVSRCVVFWRRGRCFYRSMAEGTVFARRGIAVVVNMGVRVCPSVGHEKAHCWLTYAGAPLFDASVTSLYPDCLGASEDGLVYWAGDSRTVEPTDHHEKCRDNS
jgi:hypothetical protein